MSTVVSREENGTSLNRCNCTQLFLLYGPRLQDLLLNRGKRPGTSDSRTEGSPNIGDLPKKVLINSRNFGTSLYSLLVSTLHGRKRGNHDFRRDDMTTIHNCN